MRSRAEQGGSGLRILTSHVGYGADGATDTGAGDAPDGVAAVVLLVPDGRLPSAVRLVDADAAAAAAATEATGAGTGATGGSPVPSVPLTPEAPVRVGGWHVGPFARVPLPAGLAPGTYAVEALGEDGEVVRSEPFAVGADQLQRQTVSDVLAYFRAMRSAGEIDRKDRRALRWDDASGLAVDARGGWLDASGDTSKFLSHLTYTRTMSPQQTPLCAWAFLVARDGLERSHPALVRAVGTRLRDEALWGADFLVRFRAPEGYFYTGIFDALTKELDERVVTAPLQDCVRTPRYQAAYRHGGGLAIAALARASQVDDDGDHTRAEYLAAAVEGFRHLEAHNTEYLFDGRETVLDDYCALLAASELVAAGVAEALPAAHRRAGSLVGRYVRPAAAPGWFRADDEGRPFFHAAEAGLPVLALLRYAEVVPDGPGSRAAAALAQEAMLDVVARTDAVPNPFGYPRQRVVPAGGEPRDAFFFPHENETGYWWQGENATICSLAAAANACVRAGAGPQEAARLRRFAADQLAWVLGRNPFDVCLLQGRGRGNVDYESDFPNLPGGIVNGITSGWTDEEDIAFAPTDAPLESWRWVEQWIPHAGWFLLAVATTP